MTRISDLNRNQDLTDGDVFPIGTEDGSTRGVTAKDAAKYFTSEIGPIVDEAKQAALDAQQSAESAEESAAEAAAAAGVVGPQVREALRRSYAEAGYGIIGRFSNTGLVVNSVTDVVLWEPTGVAYSYSGGLPHTVGVDETPVGNPSWVDRGDKVLRKTIGLSGDPGHNGFFVGDVGQNPTIFQMRDRVFMGDGAKYTGRRTGNLGGSWLTEFAANYFEKNSQNTSLGIQGRYGLTVGGWSSDDPAPAGGTNGSSIGLAAVGVNRSSAGTARAIYAEGMHFGGASGTATGSTSGIEVQVGNYSNQDNSNAGPYALGPGVYGLTLGVEAGTDYVLGDNDTPLQTPTMPATAAMYIYGGSLGALYQKWHSGIIFLQNSLYRGTDGFNGNASAMKLARGHQIEWWSATGIKNSTMRSDGTSVAGKDTALLFKDDRIELCGSGELPIMALKRDTVGAVVSNALITNARANVAVRYGVESSTATDVAVELSSKGQGIIRLQTHDGASEHLRIDPIAGATDFVTVRGGAGNGVANINTNGASTDVHLRLTPKGLGTIQYGKTQTPITDNQLDYGSASLRGRTAYFGTGTINTSDAREKTAPMLIDDAVLDAWGDVQLITFQWLDAIQQKGEGVARWHFGVIAQQVRDAFAARGLDGTHYGLLCYDEWDDTYTKVQTNEGEMVTKTRLVRKPVMIPGKDGGEPVVKMVMVYLKNEDGSPKISESGARLTDFEVVFEGVEEEYLDYADPEYAEVLEVAAGNRWGIRPDQCLFVEAAYQRRNYQRLLTRIEALEAK